MKTIFAAVITFIVAALLIQPCPAPPLIAIGIDAGVAVGEAGAVAGAEAGAEAGAGAEAAAAAGEVASGRSSLEGAIGKRAEKDAAAAVVGKVNKATKRVAERAISSQTEKAKRDLSHACFQDAVQSGLPPIQQMDNGTVLIQNVPTSCMSDLDQWNQHPDIEQFNAAYGRVKKMESSSIMIYEMPQTMQSIISSSISRMNGSPSHRKSHWN